MSEELVPIDPWSQLAEEGKSEYGAFTEFVRLPAQLRSYRMLATHLGLAESTVKSYARKFKWQERANAYDSACQRLTPQELSPGETLAHQHAVGKAMIDLGISALSLRNPQDIKVREAVQLVKIGSELERKAIGADDSGIHISISGGAVDRLNEILGEIDLEAEEVIEEEDDE